MDGGSNAAGHVIRRDDSRRVDIGVLGVFCGCEAVKLPHDCDADQADRDH